MLRRDGAPAVPRQHEVTDGGGGGVELGRLLLLQRRVGLGLGRAAMYYILQRGRVALLGAAM